MRIAAQLAVPALVLATLTGCVSNRYKTAGAIGARPDRLEADLGGEEVRARLDAVVTYKGPGTWKQEALWDEIQLTLTNPGTSAVVLTGATLTDSRGATQDAGTDPWLLERASLDQRKRYERAGVSFVLNTAGYVALTYGMTGTGALAGAALTSSWGGFATGATVGLAAVPVIAIGVHIKNVHNRHAIEAEFERRRIHFPLTLPPGGTASGSLFFPMSTSPGRLTLTRADGGVARSLVYPTPMLAGLHRPPS